MSLRSGWIVDFSGLPRPVPPGSGRLNCSPSDVTGLARADAPNDLDVLPRASQRLRKGCPYQPSTTCGPETPSPRMNRPPERWSSVIAAIAVAAGVRAESCAIDVPSLMRWSSRPTRRAASRSPSRRPPPPRSSRIRVARPPRSSLRCRAAARSPVARSNPSFSVHRPSRRDYSVKPERGGEMAVTVGVLSDTRRRRSRRSATGSRPRSRAAKAPRRGLLARSASDLGVAAQIEGLLRRRRCPRRSRRSARCSTRSRPGFGGLLEGARRAARVAGSAPERSSASASCAR